MFICDRCAEKHLSEQGLKWIGLFYPSWGPCEVCNRTRDCRDVYSGSDWAWNPPRKQTRKTKK